MLKVSIIVPVYNVEQYLHRCVDSILAQTFSDFELILIDDGSPDNSGKICDEYAARDRRIRVIHTENRGVSAARNTGLELAEGEYLTFVDSDDYVGATYLEVLLSSDCDLSVCGSFKLLENGKRAKFIQPKAAIETVSRDKIVHWFESGYLNVVWAKAFKRDVVETAKLRFATEMNFGEDTVFVMEYISRCKTVAFAEDNLYCYVKYDSGTLTKMLTHKSTTSYHLFDVYLKQWFEKYGVTSALFDSATFTTKRKLKWAFCCIYENSQLSLKEKYAWYKLFFSLSTFNDNIEIMFAEYPKKIKAVLHTKNAVMVILFQMLASGYSKVRGR